VKHCASHFHKHFVEFISSSKMSWLLFLYLLAFPGFSVFTSIVDHNSIALPCTQLDSWEVYFQLVPVSLISWGFIPVSVVPKGGITLKLMKFKFQGSSLSWTTSKPVDIEYCVRWSLHGTKLTEIHTSPCFLQLYYSTLWIILWNFLSSKKSGNLKQHIIWKINVRF